MLSYKIWGSLNESAKNEYRYITNHGIGLGTLPNNVYVRSEDLENGKTAIYTNRPLSDEELKKYDIKPEWVQEGTSKRYTIYVTSGGDGVYNSRVYDVVDSEEQASDIVSELLAQGYGASYEETGSSDLNETQKYFIDDNTKFVSYEPEIEGTYTLQDMKDIYNNAVSDEYKKDGSSFEDWLYDMIKSGVFEIKNLDLKEDAWSDNFTINIIQKDGVYWKRKSDGKIIKTSFEVFDEPTDPTEWKSEEELEKYKIGEGLKEDGYKSDSMKYNFNNNYVDISALRKYSSYLDSISSVLDNSDYNDVYINLSSDKFSNALDSFMDALVDEDVRIDSEMKSIENNLVNKK